MSTVRAKRIDGDQTTFDESKIEKFKEQLRGAG